MFLSKQAVESTLGVESGSGTAVCIWGLSGLGQPAVQFGYTFLGILAMGSAQGLNIRDASLGALNRALVHILADPKP